MSHSQCINMSDITATANRVIPITVELYYKDTEEFPDLNVVGQEDSEYKIQFNCTNKNTASPHTVAVSDLSNADKKEIIFTNPDDITYVRPATFGSDGTDGIIFYICQLTDLNTVGKWKIRAKMTEGDVEINYPDIPFLVE
jgi:hypothetical protein